MFRIMLKFQYNRACKNYHEQRAGHLEERVVHHRQKAQKHLNWILAREAESKRYIDELRADLHTAQSRHKKLVQTHSVSTDKIDSSEPVEVETKVTVEQPKRRRAPATAATT